MDFWLSLTVILTITGAYLVFYYSNKPLLLLCRKAEDEVRAKCLNRPRIQIETMVNDLGVDDKYRETGQKVLQALAKIIGVPPETLRADDMLGDLLLVRFDSEKTGSKRETKPTSLIAFYDGIYHYMMSFLDEDQHKYFLSLLGIPPCDEDAFWDCISSRPLGEIVRFMAEAKAQPGIFD